MSARISRRRLAKYAAAGLMQGDETVLEELAALLKAERREREIDLVARDIEGELASHGVMVVTAESAASLTETERTAIAKMLGSADVRLREVVKPELIGGIKITTPSQSMDATIIKKLSDLRARNV